jgi:hypothetical protein
MNRTLTIIRGFIESGCDYPGLVREGRAWPKLDELPPDTWPRIEEPGRDRHDRKNLAAEICDHNGQWAAKFFSFVIMWLLALVGALAVAVIVLISI